MTAHPVAFVDEAFIRVHQHPGTCLFAAVFVDAEDLHDVIDATRYAADPHASDLYRRGHIQPIEDMLDTTEAHAVCGLRQELAASDPIGRSAATDRSETSHRSMRSRLPIEYSGRQSAVDTNPAASRNVCKPRLHSNEMPASLISVVAISYAYGWRLPLPRLLPRDI
ncbi:hypothetical protein [Winogradskya humida]|uniref:hypothetical protein n=1 Tax=Winogradskya humida TaxID=113566 RepID=UPI001942D8CA|nr:hypothetical protein [Actinoplanes humidus]